MEIKRKKRKIEKDEDPESVEKKKKWIGKGNRNKKEEKNNV